MDINSYTSVKLWLSNHLGTFKKGQDFDLLHLLIKNHPAYTEWQYNIPLVFKVTKKKVLQLMVSFQPGKFRIVSWVRCCKKVVQCDPLTSAMRHAIRRQISMYKSKHPDKVCAVCNHDKRIEVDHYPVKFLTLKQNFSTTIISPTNFRYHPKRGYCMFTKKDVLWKKAWQKHHLKLASYRYLCSTCNKKY